MRTLSRIGLAAAVILALSGMTDVAYGSVEKFFITGNPTTCSAVFSALQAQHPADFPPGSFSSSVNAQIVVSPLADGFYSEASPGPDGKTQIVDISSVSADGTLFDWKESTSPQRGFDAVSIKAGNGRTVYVYRPDGTAGNNLSDLNTTQSVTSVLFCADGNVTIVGNPLCNLPSNQLTAVCNALGQVVVEISTPGNSETQTCACPGITLNACNAKPVCVPSSTNDCIAQFPGGFCDPHSPDDAGTDPLETTCCLVSPFTQLPLTLTGVPQGTSSVTGKGSCCTNTTKTTTGGGGTSTVQSCYTISFPPDPPCP